MTLADQLRAEGLQKGLQKGLQDGLQKGLQDGILEALDIRFGESSVGLREAIQSIHEEARLRELHKAAIQLDSLEEFARAL